MDVKRTNSAVLIVDDHEAFGASLGRSFRGLGWEVYLASDPAAAKTASAHHRARLIVTELKVAGCWAFDFAQELSAAHPEAKLAIATIYPSVATAVRAVRLGFDGYLAKPVEARDLIDAIFEQSAEGEGASSSAGPGAWSWPSLNRTIWEYLNQVFVTAGTMTEAARRLGIDRRSLRRMLAKYPPVH